MARYSSLIGRRVEVQFPAGDIYLPATATLVADSGKSIFLEERVHQGGTVKAFRWEIPYPSIVRVNECQGLPTVTAEPASPAAKEPADEPGPLGLKNHTNEA